MVHPTHKIYRGMGHRDEGAVLGRVLRDRLAEEVTFEHRPEYKGEEA